MRRSGKKKSQLGQHHVADRVSLPAPESSADTRMDLDFFMGGAKALKVVSRRMVKGWTKEGKEFMYEAVVVE
jgi:hypothetical protein